MQLAQSASYSLVSRLFLEASTDLLSMQNIPAQVKSSSAAKKDTGEARYVSVLGATGEGIALSSLLKLTTQLLVALHPLAPEAISDGELADCCREFNNQLVGRLKNKLLRYGVTATLGLPVILTGKDVNSVPAPDAVVETHLLETSKGEIELVLQMILDPELQFQEQPASEEEALFEGELALF